MSARRDDVDAVILVGGLGTRLRPLTLSAPKPMLPTAGVPFLAHLIARIRDAGIHHIVLGTSYQPQVFETYFGDGQAFGVELEYVVESEPLGTGGGIRNVAQALRGDTALIFNGDVLSGLDLRHLLDSHVQHRADVTLHLTRVPDPTSFGCVPTDPAGRVTAFLEKDPNPVTDQINAGTYVFDRAILEAIPTGRPVSVERETFPALLSGGARVYGHADTSYWRDLGTPGDFVAGSADLVRGIAPSSALPGRAGEYLALPTAMVEDRATVAGGSTLGRGCFVGTESLIDASVLFDHASIGKQVTVRRSIIGAGAVVKDRAVLEDVVIGDHAVVGERVELRRGARVWPHIELPECSVRFSSDL